MNHCTFAVKKTIKSTALVAAGAIICFFIIAVLINQNQLKEYVSSANSTAKTHYNYFSQEIIELSSFTNVPEDGEYVVMGECHDFASYEESFLEGIVKGLEHFGGTPQKIIFDNARVAVKEGFGHHAKATDKYLSLSAHYSFRPVFCNPAQGHEKGLVEGLVGLVRRNFFVPVPNISTIGELNTKLLEFCEKYRRHKISGKSMTVGEMAENCKEHWIPLPPYRYDTSNTLQVKADDFSLVRFDHNKYSVPYQYSSKTITIKGSGNKIVMLFCGETIAEYDRDYRHNQTHYRLEHYIGLIEKRPRSVYNAAPIKETVPKELYGLLHS